MTPEEEKPTYNNSLNQDSALESDSNQFQADPQADQGLQLGINGKHHIESIANKSTEVKDVLGV